MKAFVCNEFGPIESHKIEEMPDPIAGDGQVVVDIKATGISFPDVLIVQAFINSSHPSLLALVVKFQELFHL